MPAGMSATLRERTSRSLPLAIREPCCTGSGDLKNWFVAEPSPWFHRSIKLYQVIASSAGSPACARASIGRFVPRRLSQLLKHRVRLRGTRKLPDPFSVPFVFDHEHNPTYPWEGLLTTQKRTLR